VLIHEVYSWEGLRDRTKEWRDYHSSVHTSTRELAQIAAAARPGLLILYHQLFNGVTEAELVREVEERYDGTVVSGRDLDVY
jgi:ribonuclease BN (tRNA processing enzyme)